MKLSKTSQWILTIGILAILLVSLGIMYSRQKAEQSELSINIAQAQQDFMKYSKYTAKYTTEKKELEVRRNEANSRIATIQAEFRKYTQSIEISETLFEAAEAANVTVTELSSSLPEEEKIRIEEGEESGEEEEEEKSITFQVFSITLMAEGEVVDLIRFSEKVSDSFCASSIELVEIEVPQEEEEGEEKEIKKPTITLQLKIYAYEGE